ncbi:MAG: AAA family ATPase [Helicobacteraceae bacterium]|nr:AAA family ATPase [Helicobacteraceae bacterium]
MSFAARYQRDFLSVIKEFTECLFVVDGLKHLVRDIKNDREVKETMEKLVRLRDARATIVVLHHANKRGAQKGSSEISDWADNIMEIDKRQADDNQITLSFEPTKTRNALEETTLAIDLKTLEITESEYNDKTSVDREMNDELIERVLTALKSAPEGLSQSALLSAIGKSKSDIKTRDALYAMEGEYWQITRGVNNSAIFTAIEYDDREIANAAENEL